MSAIDPENYSPSSYGDATVCEECFDDVELTERIAQDDRVNVDYIPTQIVTEFLRDYDFAGGPIDGISYVTALDMESFNTVLFATQDNVVDQSAATDSASKWLILDDNEITIAS